MIFNLLHRVNLNLQFSILKCLFKKKQSRNLKTSYYCDILYVPVISNKIFQVDDIEKIWQEIKSFLSDLQMKILEINNEMIPLEDKFLRKMIKFDNLTINLSEKKKFCKTKFNNANDFLLKSLYWKNFKQM